MKEKPNAFMFFIQVCIYYSACLPLACLLLRRTVEIIVSPERERQEEKVIVTREIRQIWTIRIIIILLSLLLMFVSVKNIFNDD